MKKVSTLLFFFSFLIVFEGFSQVPNAFNYQAIVRNSSGEILANKTVSFRISLLRDSESGTVVYSETHSLSTNVFGLVNLKIGEGTKLSGNFSPADWGDIIFTKVEIDPAGGSSFSHLATTKLSSVPYAFKAQTVVNDKVADADADPANEIQSLAISGNDLSISGGNTVILPTSGGSSDDNLGNHTATQNINLNGHYLSGNGEDKGVFVGSNGNVGFGTANPEQKLHIDKGNILVKGANSFQATNDEAIVMLGDNNNYIEGVWGYGVKIGVYGISDAALAIQAGNGNVGIGTLTPSGNLHVSGNSGVLFEGTYDEGTIPKEGTGTRMMWYPKKAAFRVGSIDNDEWDDANIGYYSCAMGRNSMASGEFSTAMGWSIALGKGSTAMGGSAAYGDYSTAMGSGIAIGFESVAIGKSTKAESYVCTAIGQFNIGGGDPDNWVASDPLFEIGNGLAQYHNSNALTVLKNGNVGIGTATPSRTLYVSGDAGGSGAWHNDSDERLKKNINTIPNALDKVTQLRGVNYEWKDVKTHSKGLQMGFIAQEAKDVIPEVVEKSGEYYSMQYAPVTALLVEAVKEQQKIINELKEKNKQLQANNNQIKNRLDKIEKMLSGIASNNQK